MRERMLTGSVASDSERGVSCNPASRRSEAEDGLRSGVLVLSGPC